MKSRMENSGAKAVIRRPFTVYRPSHRVESLKRLDVAAAYHFDLSRVRLWVDSLKSLKSLILCFYTFSPFPAPIFRNQKVANVFQAFSSLFKPFQAFQALSKGQAQIVTCHGIKPFQAISSPRQRPSAKKGRKSIYHNIKPFKPFTVHGPRKTAISSMSAKN